MFVSNVLWVVIVDNVLLVFVIGDVLHFFFSLMCYSSVLLVVRQDNITSFSWFLDSSD